MPNGAIGSCARTAVPSGSASMAAKGSPGPDAAGGAAPLSVAVTASQPSAGAAAATSCAKRGWVMAPTAPLWLAK